jgi:uncharacterized protein
LHLIAKKLEASPTLARIAPFAIFLGLTFCQGQFGEAGRYWFYLIKTVIGAWLVWSLRLAIGEMKWALSWAALAAGVAVFALWVGLDRLYPSLDELLRKACPLLDRVGLKAWCPPPGGAPPAWNPHQQFGANSSLAWFFITVRLAGSSIVVPPLEEVFYRSFLYRYVTTPEFEKIRLGVFRWTPFLVTSGIFGLSHREWLAGILCGFTYQGLVCWKKRLGDAMTAHAITNFLLGVWVVWKGQWQFW